MEIYKLSEKRKVANGDNLEGMVVVARKNSNYEECEAYVLEQYNASASSPEDFEVECMALAANMYGELRVVTVTVYGGADCWEGAIVNDEGQIAEEVCVKVKVA